MATSSFPQAGVVRGDTDISTHGDGFTSGGADFNVPGAGKTPIDSKTSPDEIWAAGSNSKTRASDNVTGSEGADVSHSTNFGIASAKENVSATVTDSKTRTSNNECKLERADEVVSTTGNETKTCSSDNATESKGAGVNHPTNGGNVLAEDKNSTTGMHSDSIDVFQSEGADVNHLTNFGTASAKENVSATGSDSKTRGSDNECKLEGADEVVSATGNETKTHSTDNATESKRAGVNHPTNSGNVLSEDKNSTTGMRGDSIDAFQSEGADEKDSVIHGNASNDHAAGRSRLSSFWSCIWRRIWSRESDVTCSMCNARMGLRRSDLGNPNAARSIRCKE